ncbi:MAG: hypothetical protein R3F61_15265 [Myxococcota bacterium]
MRHLPLLVLAACAPDYGPPTCEGGGEPGLELGDGGRMAFVPFEDGGVLPTRGTPPGADIDLWTTGLDVGQGITAIVRIAADGGPTEDSLATLVFSCADTGNGWTNVLAQLPASAVSGSNVTVEAVLTDVNATTVTAMFEGVLE